MTGRQLVMNDGTIIPDGEAGFSSGFLWLFLPGYTIQQAAGLAFDPHKTAVIEFDYGDMTDRFEGYTNCTEISANEDQATVCLTKGGS